MPRKRKLDKPEDDGSYNVGEKWFSADGDVLYGYKPPSGMPQYEINRSQSRQRVLRVASLMEEGHSYSGACSVLGYRKDTTSRAKQKFIRDGDRQVIDAFDAIKYIDFDEAVRKRISAIRWKNE